MLSRSFPQSLNLSRQVFHTICSSSYHSFIHNLNYYRKLRLYSVTCLSLSSSLFKSKDEPGTCLHTFVENYFGYTSKWWDVIFASLSRRQLREAKWSNDLYKLYLAPVSQRSWVQIPYGPEYFFFQVLFSTTRFSSVVSCEELLISSLHRGANMWISYI